MDFSFVLVVVGLFLVSALGYSLSLFRSRRDYAEDAVAFGAGAMISVALLHVFPEAVATEPKAALAFLWGFFLIYLIENFFSVHACVEDDCHYHHMGFLSWFSITLHTLFDGIAIGASFTVDERLGFFVLFGVAIHQIPVSAALWGLLSKSRYVRTHRIGLFLIFALSASVGAVLGREFFQDASPSVLAYALAVSGGSLLYVGASDLLPTVHRKTENRPLVVALFTLGTVIVSVGSLFE